MSTPKGPLRKLAEEKARINETETPEDIECFSPAEIRRILHELRVHQIELEMQNEELRATQETLSKSRERYFDLYNLAPAGYMTVSENGLIEESNLTITTMLGIARDTLKKQPISNFIFKEDQDIYYLHIKKMLAENELQSFELRMMKKDGTPFWMQLETALTEGENGETEYRIVLSNINKRKQAEAEQEKLRDRLIQMQKLESLGVLAGGTAHDFNNLLGGIFGYVELAYKESTDETISDYLSKALINIDRSRALTQQLMTFSKGGQPIKKIDHLFPLAQKTTEFVLSGTSVLSTFQIQENLWPCDFDKNQICQVIDNITINARQAMPNGGTISFNAENISLSKNEHASLPAGNYVKLSITDQGIGMPKNILPKIFDPYYTTKEAGHGLGLSACYSIIHRHGGCLEVESKQGEGSTFTLYLPAAISSPAPPAIKSKETHKGSGTFLIMDDDECIREILTISLESFGYTVVAKTNGQDAVDFFTEEFKANRKLAGIVFDLTIPGGMGGKEAIEKIRKICPDTPAFVASGYSEDPAMANPEEYGFTASIQKPCLKEELSQMLEKYMKRSK